MSFGCSGPLVPATASVADVTDSNLMTTQYIALASGTVCETRLQHITKLFTRVQPSSRATQEVQLQQAKKKGTLDTQKISVWLSSLSGYTEILRQSSMSAPGLQVCLHQHHVQEAPSQWPHGPHVLPGSGLCRPTEHTLHFDNHDAHVQHVTLLGR